MVLNTVLILLLFCFFNFYGFTLQNLVYDDSKNTLIFNLGAELPSCVLRLALNTTQNTYYLYILYHVSTNNTVSESGRFVLL